MSPHDFLLSAQRTEMWATSFPGLFPLKLGTRLKRARTLPREYHVVYHNDDVTDGHFSLVPQATSPYEQNVEKMDLFRKMAFLSGLGFFR